MVNAAAKICMKLQELIDKTKPADLEPLPGFETADTCEAILVSCDADQVITYQTLSGAPVDPANIVPAGSQCQEYPFTVKAGEFASLDSAAILAHVGIPGGTLKSLSIASKDCEDPLPFAVTGAGSSAGELDHGGVQHINLGPGQDVAVDLSALGPGESARFCASIKP